MGRHAGQGRVLVLDGVTALDEPLCPAREATASDLLGVTPTRHWLEFMDWAEPVLEAPLRVVDGFARIPDRPGAGIRGNEAAAARYAA